MFVLMADGALPIVLTPDGLTELIAVWGRIAGGTIMPAAVGPPGPPLIGPFSPLPMPTADTNACVSAKLLVCCTPYG